MKDGGDEREKRGKARQGNEQLETCDSKLLEKEGGNHGEEPALGDVGVDVWAWMSRRCRAILDLGVPRSL